MQLALQEFGTVDDEVFGWISQLIGVPRQDVPAIANYLDMLHPELRARYRVLVCTHTHCAGAGSEIHLRQIEETLGIHPACPKS